MRMVRIMANFNCKSSANANVFHLYLRFLDFIYDLLILIMFLAVKAHRKVWALLLNLCC